MRVKFGLFPFVVMGSLLPLAAWSDDRTPDLKNGRMVAKVCRECHAFRESKRQKFGPNLAGLFGRPAGQVDGYPYSNAMREIGVVWTSETLDRFLTNPAAFIPGTEMKLSGIKSAASRADLIAYLALATER